MTTLTELTAAAMLSLVLCYLTAEALVFATSRHGRFAMDTTSGVQKSHLAPTPRIGGIAVYLSLVGGSLAATGDVHVILRTLLIAGLPALAAGVIEDVTQRAGVWPRLAATTSSGLVACWLTGVSVTRLALPGMDDLLTIAPIAVAFTAFAVSGMANAINIIDGFHGLAGGSSCICLFALAAIAGLCGDFALAMVCLLLACCLVGFLLVNFPWGRLFLGDGGAYFAGFAIAWLAVLLPIRNPEASPWASLLICAYPVTEVLYSILRRWRMRRMPGDADRQHLHSLVAIVVQRRLPHLDPTLQNSTVSVCMWCCAAFPAFLAVTLYDRTTWLMASAAACLLLYHWLYRRVARL